MKYFLVTFTELYDGYEFTSTHAIAAHDHRSMMIKVNSLRHEGNDFEDRLDKVAPISKKEFDMFNELISRQP
jgi:hypothetical protein